MKPTVTSLARSNIYNPYLLGAGIGYTNPYLYGGLYGTNARSSLSLAANLRASG